MKILLSPAKSIQTEGIKAEVFLPVKPTKD